MYVYICSDPGVIWTAGIYDPNGNWEPESDHDSVEKAADRVHWLNGGTAKGESKKAEAEA